MFLPKRRYPVREMDGQGGRNGPSEAYVQNFHFRSVGVVEAIMDICGWRMHGCSQKSIFLPTDKPQDRKRVLKRKFELDKVSRASTDIFLDDKWKKYLKRPRNKEGKKRDVVNAIFCCLMCMH